MILCGLVFEGLAQEDCAFVVNLIPVFAVAHVQGRINVAGALLMPDVNLRRTYSADETQSLQS